LCFCFALRCAALLSSVARDGVALGFTFRFCFRFCFRANFRVSVFSMLDVALLLLLLALLACSHCGFPTTCRSKRGYKQKYVWPKTRHPLGLEPPPWSSKNPRRSWRAVHFSQPPRAIQSTPSSHTIHSKPDQSPSFPFFSALLNQRRSVVSASWTFALTPPSLSPQVVAASNRTARCFLFFPLRSN